MGDQKVPSYPLLRYQQLLFSGFYSQNCNVMFETLTYVSRRKSLINSLDSGIILLLGNVDSPMNYAANTFHFRQDSTFLYFFGLDMPGIAGVLDVESGEEILFGNDADMEDIIWVGPQIPFADSAGRVGVSGTRPYSALKDYLASAIQKGRKIHFLPPYRAENKITLESLTGIHVARQKEYASVALIKAVVNIRSVKELVEIAEIEKACTVGYEMHVAAMQMAKSGVWEQTIAGRLEGIAASAGGMLSFPVILSQNGETLHNHNHSQLLTEGRLLLTDAGAETALHYASDFTRTTPVNGKFTQQQREIYEIVLEANNHATSLIRPGVTYLSVHLAASEVIAKGLTRLGLMKGDPAEAVEQGAHALFFPHGLGHMMGLDVHDMEDLGQIYVGYDDEIRPSGQFGTAYLRLGRRLQEGFVVTNEPGIYFIPALMDQWRAEGLHRDFICYDRLGAYRDFGGIRLEDDILVTPEGSRILGQRVPVNPDEVAALAAG